MSGAAPAQSAQVAELNVPVPAMITEWSTAQIPRRPLPQRILRVVHASALSRLRPWVVSGTAAAAGGVRYRRLPPCRSLTATPILSLEDALALVNMDQSVIKATCPLDETVIAVILPV